MKTKKELKLTEIDIINKILRYIMLFIFLSLVIVVAQLGFVYIIHSRDMKFSLIQKISVYVTLGFSALFIVTQLIEFVKYRKLTNKIKKDGSAVDQNGMYMLAGNSTLGHASRLLQNILLTITLVLCFGFITYSIFDYVYNDAINLYMPLMVLLAMTSGFSVKYVECLREIG